MIYKFFYFLEKNNFFFFLVSFIGVDVGNIFIRISRFFNYFRNFLSFNDVLVMEMVVRVVGWLVYFLGFYVVEYVEYEVKRVLEWLISDR